jgi:hypothetical protein
MNLPQNGHAATSTTAFASSADAWFWTMRALRARHDGQTRSGNSAIARPCEPDDVIRALDTLFRRRKLTGRHARVLRNWGEQQRTPDPRSAGANECGLWREAIAALDSQLRAKGIIETNIRKHSLTRPRSTV